MGPLTEAPQHTNPLFEAIKAHTDKDCKSGAIGAPWGLVGGIGIRETCRVAISILQALEKSFAI